MSSAVAGRTIRSLAETPKDRRGANAVKSRGRFFDKDQL